MWFRFKKISVSKLREKERGRGVCGLGLRKSQSPNLGKVCFRGGFTFIEYFVKGAVKHKLYMLTHGLEYARDLQSLARQRYNRNSFRLHRHCLFHTSELIDFIFTYFTDTGTRVKRNLALAAIIQDIPQINYT